MQFLSDENVYFKTVRLLRSLGFKVKTAQELNLRSASDSIILEETVKRKSILISRDSDFLYLAVFTKNPHFGVIVLRINPGEENSVYTVLQNFLKEKRNLRDRLVVINSLGYRIEKRLG